MNLDPQEFVVHDISRFPFCVFRARRPRRRAMRCNGRRRSTR